MIDWSQWDWWIVWTAHEGAASSLDEMIANAQRCMQESVLGDESLKCYQPGGKTMDSVSMASTDGARL